MLINLGSKWTVYKITFYQSIFLFTIKCIKMKEIILDEKRINKKIFLHMLYYLFNILYQCHTFSYWLYMNSNLLSIKHFRWNVILNQNLSRIYPIWRINKHLTFSCQNCVHRQTKKIKKWKVLQTCERVHIYHRAKCFNNIYFCKDIKRVCLNRFFDISKYWKCKIFSFFYSSICINCN